MYRASEMLVISGTAGQPGDEFPPVIVRITRNADFGPSVARLGGSGRVSFDRWDPLAGAFEVVTTSSNRDDANRTLAIADSVIRQKLTSEQAGTRRADLVSVDTLTRHNA
jgi:hypothetical protein